MRRYKTIWKRKFHPKLAKLQNEDLYLSTHTLLQLLVGTIFYTDGPTLKKLVHFSSSWKYIKSFQTYVFSETYFAIFLSLPLYLPLSLFIPRSRSLSLSFSLSLSLSLSLIFPVYLISKSKILAIVHMVIDLLYNF